jgi:hypothetical protein
VDKPFLELANKVLALSSTSFSWCQVLIAYHFRLDIKVTAD